MSEGIYHFGGFTLDALDRRLVHDHAVIEISARYLDALALLVRQQGKLITKQQFLEEVWHGVPVTDEALTQCIRSLRRHLGDEARRPRFIETVPKHGYRFVAPVTLSQRLGVPPAEAEARQPEKPLPSVAPFRTGSEIIFRTARAGMVGGSAAGLLGGLIYGFSGVFDSPSGGGALSGIVIMSGLTMVIGLLGGAGVGLGIGSAALARHNTPVWIIAGGATGGLVLGAVVKLLGADAFDLLFGQPLGDVTGAPEGAVLGGMVGAGVWATGRLRRRYALVLSGLMGLVAGAVISLGGGRLMGGSLYLLSQQLPDSRLSLDHLGRGFGEADFGPISAAISSGLEGLLFASLVVAAIRFEKATGEPSQTALKFNVK